MADGPYKHFFINDSGKVQKYTSKNKGGNKKKIPSVDRIVHGQKIQKKLMEAWEQAREIDAQRTVVSLPTKNGIYLEFESTPDFELATKSLEHHRNGAGIRLLNVRTEAVDGATVNRATVFIPSGKESFYIRKVQAYLEEEDSRSHKPKNEKLVASMNNIKIAVLESFWHGKKEWIPVDLPEWCEIWLSSDSDEAEQAFRRTAEELQIPMQKETLKFPERRVILGKVNSYSLQELIARSPCIAEFRRASETAAFFVEMENREQADWAKDLRDRLHVEDNTEVCICILDTGVNNGHILLEPILANKDCQCYDRAWGPHDHEGHGTKMAGLTGYGDLQTVLESSSLVKVSHILESVKILPSMGENDPKLYGAIVTQSVSNMMIENPKRRRIICMAVTAPKYETGDGRPSSWSAAIDELVSGYLDEQQKLFFVSAGNVNDMADWKSYPVSNKTRTVQNPGQSWNAVTVGAYTEKTQFDDIKYHGSKSVAQAGGLSPFSSTSCLWDTKWPVKPDIVLEGGNLLEDSLGCSWCEELSLVTTCFKPTLSQFDIINATSAATAQAAWMAAQIQVEYPDAWPETIRALLIHSAEWTTEMKRQFLHGSAKRDYRELMRVCGYGVPNLDRALWCVKNSVNLVMQTDLQPFDQHTNGRYITKDMHIHELPWPKDVLLSLGSVPVSMKVTLSYFIEPGPGEIGWKDRYRYASCALRFDVNGTDTREAFLARINAVAAAEEEGVDSSGGSVNWILGEQNRHVGSIHSDTWEGTAAQLATSNLIGIYPAVGWWRERAWLIRWDKRIRYSLIVSLHTPEQSVDLYTPILNKIKVIVPVNKGK